jgi:hypothetical protein
MPLDLLDIALDDLADIARLLHTQPFTDIDVPPTTDAILEGPEGRQPRAIVTVGAVLPLSWAAAKASSVHQKGRSPTCAPTGGCASSVRICARAAACSAGIRRQAAAPIG